MARRRAGTRRSPAAAAPSARRRPRRRRCPSRPRRRSRRVRRSVLAQVHHRAARGGHGVAHAQRAPHAAAARSMPRGRCTTSFWVQVVGPRDSVLSSIADPAARRLADVMVGPWDRLEDDAPFVAGVGPKPARRELLSARHDQGGVRARGAGRWRARGQPQVAVHDGPPRRVGPPVDHSVLAASSPRPNERAAAKVRAGRGARRGSPGCDATSRCSRRRS